MVAIEDIADALPDSKVRDLIQFLVAQKDTLSPLLILTHDYPDPDALGSAYALQYLVGSLFGITSKIVYRGIIGRVENKTMVKILKIPIFKFSRSHFKKFPRVALVDTQPSFGNNPFPKNKTACIVIDQHASAQKPDAQCTVVDTECGATSVLLAQALLLTGLQIPVRVATALVYGIITDTMNLYRSNKEEILKTYMGILPYSDLRALSKIQHPSWSRESYLVMEKGLNNAKVRRGLIVSHLGAVNSPDFVSQVADFLIGYRRMFWCLCSGRFKGKLYLSFRLASRRGDAGDILRSVVMNPEDAGGHDLIAGGSVKVGGNAGEATWAAKEDEITEKLVRRLRIRKKSDFSYPFRSDLPANG